MQQPHGHQSVLRQPVVRDCHWRLLDVIESVVACSLVDVQQAAEAHLGPEFIWRKPLHATRDARSRWCLRLRQHAQPVPKRHVHRIVYQMLQKTPGCIAGCRFPIDCKLKNQLAHWRGNDLIPAGVSSLSSRQRLFSSSRLSQQGAHTSAAPAAGCSCCSVVNGRTGGRDHGNRLRCD